MRLVVILSQHLTWSTMVPIGLQLGTTSAHDQASVFDRLNAYGTYHCRKFRTDILNSHPQLASSFAYIYEDIAKKKGYSDANQNLRELDSRLRIRDLNLSSDSEEIKRFAEHLAIKCRHYVARFDYGEKVHLRGGTISWLQ